MSPLLILQAAATVGNRPSSFHPFANRRAAPRSRGARQVLIAAVALAAVAVGVPAAHAAPVFQGLGLSAGALNSQAFGVSADGTAIVGTEYHRSGYRYATLWTSEAELTLLPGRSSTSRAYSVSADGDLVFGNYGSTMGARAHWARENGVYGLNTIDELLNALVVSDDGRFAAGWTGGTSSYRYHLEGTDVVQTTSLGPLSGSRSNNPTDISADGAAIVGVSTSGSYSQAFRWTESDGMVGLGELAGGNQYSMAYAVSGDGAVVVGTSVSSRGYEGFRWTESDGMQPLSGESSADMLRVAQATNYTGDIIVGNKAANDGGAMIWTAEAGVRSLKELLTVDYNLDLDGWELASAQDITPDGTTIVGYGLNPDGQMEAWMISGLDLGVTGPIPGVAEPHTLAILGIGLVALGAGLGRRRQTA